MVNEGDTLLTHEAIRIMEGASFIVAFYGKGKRVTLIEAGHDVDDFVYWRKGDVQGLMVDSLQVLTYPDAFDRLPSLPEIIRRLPPPSRPSWWQRLRAWFK